MERHFDEELKLLKQKLLVMADTAQEMIGLAVKSLVDRKEEPAKQVFTLEEKVNRLEIEIENEVLRLIARHQPAAGDLRLLTATLKINNDLERVADQTCNISETALYLLKEPPMKVIADIAHMASLAQKMIRDSIEAFVRHDSALAQKVCADDDQVDKSRDKMFSELLAAMIKDPSLITRGVELILVGRNIERIADHATNIGEEVIFIEQGKNIKHHIQEEDREA